MKPSVAELVATRETQIPRIRFKNYVERVLRYSNLSKREMKKIIAETFIPVDQEELVKYCLKCKRKFS